METDDLLTQNKVIGINQSKRAIENDEVKHVFLAADAESRIVSEIKALCGEHSCEIRMYPSMKELGSAAGIRIGAAIVAILK